MKPENVIFGMHNANNDEFIDIVNYCILMAKFYIKLSRKKQKDPNLIDFLRFLKNRVDTELLYHKIEGKKESSGRKWSVIAELL